MSIVKQLAKEAAVKQAGPAGILGKGLGAGLGGMFDKVVGTGAKAFGWGMRNAPKTTMLGTAAAIPAANELLAAGGQAVNNAGIGSGWSGFGGVNWDPGRQAAEMQSNNSFGGHMRNLITKPIQSTMGLLGFTAADNAPRYNGGRRQAWEQSNPGVGTTAGESRWLDFGPNVQRQLDQTGQYLGGWDYSKPEHQAIWSRITGQQYQGGPKPQGAAPAAPAFRPANLPEFLPRVGANF